MSRLEPTQVIHPERRDGSEEDRRFLNLLAECTHSAGKGRDRADVRLIQRELFKRGWHP